MLLVCVLAQLVVGAAGDAPEEHAAQEHVSISVGAFAGYLSQVEVHAKVLMAKPFVAEVMWFRGMGSFWPSGGSLPRDGGGVAAGARAPVLSKNGLELFASGLAGYRLVVLGGYGFASGGVYHGVLCEGVVEALWRFTPRFAAGLRGAVGFMYFPGQRAPYFNFHLELPVGGFAPEWQLNVEVVF